MANILDIRRRIRSVVNTRQITKAMKVVSAAKLRRAQERTLAARPYATMLTNVLKSLVARTEIYDPETGEPKHPLLAQRAEKNILLIVVTGDKGLPVPSAPTSPRQRADLLNRNQTRTLTSRRLGARAAISFEGAIPPRRNRLAVWRMRKIPKKLGRVRGNAPGRFKSPASTSGFLANSIFRRRGLWRRASSSATTTN